MVGAGHQKVLCTWCWQPRVVTCEQKQPTPFSTSGRAGPPLPLRVDDSSLHLLLHCWGWCAIIFLFVSPPGCPVELAFHPLQKQLPGVAAAAGGPSLEVSLRLGSGGPASWRRGSGELWSCVAFFCLQWKQFLAARRAPARRAAAEASGRRDGAGRAAGPAGGRAARPADAAGPMPRRDPRAPAARARGRPPPPAAPGSPRRARASLAGPPSDARWAPAKVCRLPLKGSGAPAPPRPAPARSLHVNGSSHASQ